MWAVLSLSWLHSAVLACEGSLRQSVNKWVCLVLMKLYAWTLRCDSLAAPGRYCLWHPGSVSLEEHGVFDAVCGIFNCSIHTLSCGMWDLVPWPRIEPRPPALGAWTQPLDHQGSPWISFNYQVSTIFFKIIFQAFWNVVTMCCSWAIQNSTNWIWLAGPDLMTCVLKCSPNSSDREKGKPWKIQSIWSLHSRR